eukprot:SAG31_NODE_579_length_13948_cov_5.599105_5_plen_325_part_00
MFYQSGLHRLWPLALWLRAGSAEVQVKMLKDTNIGYAHGSGNEKPGEKVAGYPSVIFYDHVNTPTECAIACVKHSACTGFVHTDDKQQQKQYANTCYFRTDGCHDKSCDRMIRAEGHHESGYLYCENDPTALSQRKLDECGHDDPSLDGGSSSIAFVSILLTAATVYVGFGVLLGYRTGRVEIGSGRGNFLGAHPHYKRWMEIVSLVHDGIAFARNGDVRSRRESRVPRATNNMHDELTPRAHHSTASKNNGKKGRMKDGKSKKGKASDKEKANKAEQIDGPTQQIVIAPNVREWQPTRSVLLSSGARETGVKVSEHVPGQGLR